MVLRLDASVLSDQTKLGLFIRTDLAGSTGQNWEQHEQHFVEYLNWLKQKQASFKSDKGFLHLVFYKTHRKYLGQYEQYASFNEMFSKSKLYDCVTATALYAIILEELGYSFEIRETDYHVYLIVDGDNRQYMLETTDPLYGFVSDSKEMAIRQEQVVNDAVAYNTEYAMQGVGSDEEGGAAIAVELVNNTITITQLAGLQYYNQALRAFNTEHYRDAYRHVIVAQGIYPSKRIRYAASFMFAIAFED